MDAEAARLVSFWRINYALHLDPKDLHRFWAEGAPPACALALKAACDLIERIDTSAERVDSARRDRQEP